MWPTQYRLTVTWARGQEPVQITLPQLLRVRLPEETVELAEVDLLANNDPWPERVPTRVSLGTLEAEVAYHPDLHEGEDTIGEIVGRTDVGTMEVHVEYRDEEDQWQTLWLGDAEAVNLGDSELVRRDAARRTYTFHVVRRNA